MFFPCYYSIRKNQNTKDKGKGRRGEEKKGRRRRR
jgi:hypothetical protein